MAGQVVLKCKNGHIHVFMLGERHQYPYVQSSLDNAIREGKYGEKWKSLIEENERRAVDAADVLIVCPTCRTFKWACDMSIRETKEGYRHLDGIRRRDCKVIKSYKHICKCCNGEMKKYRIKSPKLLDHIVCPDCGEKMEFDQSNVLYPMD